MTVAALPHLAVFDMAGTTVDDDGGCVNRCLRDALAGAGLSVKPREVDSVMGLPKPEALRRLIERGGPRADLTDRLDAIHADFLRRMIDHYARDPSVREVAGAGRVFAALRSAGIRVALDTGFSRDITDVILDRLGWARDGLIDASVTSDEVPRGRPHPDMIRRLMERLGVDDPARVLKVGDTPADLQEGTNAGCGLVVGVATGAFDLASLATHPHTHLLATVAELPGLLGLPGSAS